MNKPSAPQECDPDADAVILSRAPSSSSARRVVRPVTPARLEAAALRYLQRFSASQEQVRRVLTRRIQRARAAGQTLPEAETWVQTLLTKLIRLGYLDDRRFAEQRVASLQRRGKSQTVIRQHLRARGLDPAQIDRALAEQRDALISDDPDADADPDCAAAWIVATRSSRGEPFST